MSMTAEKDGDASADEAEVGYLGYGIDLFHVDPWMPKYKSRILIDSLQTERHALTTTGYRETYQDTFLHLAHTLTVEAGLKGSYGDFSGSVSSKFGSVEKRTEKKHIQRISFTVSGNSHAIKASRKQLSTLMNDGFKDAIATATTADLFRDYGTHLINKIITGGRAEFYTQTADITSMTSKEFKIISRAKYKGAGGKIEGNNDTETTDKKKEHLVSGSVNVDTIGGSPQAAIKIKDGSWEEWAKSCVKFPGFLGYDEDDGLVPIWELAPTRPAGTKSRGLIKELRQSR
jgi:hypothetical protein